MLSIYDPDASIADRIHYLKFYETYDGEPINQKLNQLLTVEKYNIFMEQLIDAILYTRNIHNGRGLRDLTYSYLFTLQQFVPMKAVFILYIMVNNGTKHIRKKGVMIFLYDRSFVSTIINLKRTIKNGTR